MILKWPTAKLNLWICKHGFIEGCVLIASVDTMSAACLLKRYLEDRGAGALDASFCPFPPPPDVAMFDYNTVKSYVRSLYYSEDNSIENSLSWLKSQNQRKVLPHTVHTYTFILLNLLRRIYVNPSISSCSPQPLVMLYFSIQLVKAVYMLLMCIYL